MPDGRPRDLIIVGGGPAGLTAALYAGRYRIDTHLIESCVPGGEMSLRDRVEAYPGFPEGISGYELAELMRRQAESYGAELSSGLVERMERRGREWLLVCGDRKLVARAVIVATGERYRKLGVPGEERLAGKGVAYCAAKEGMRFRDKVVAVVGSTNAALETAEFLSRIASDVVLVCEGDSITAEKVLHERVYANPKIRVMPMTRILSVEGRDGVKGLHCFDQSRGTEVDIDVQGVFVLIGWEPNSELLKGIAELDRDGYVKADETTRTSVPGLFVAGDVRTKPLRRPTTAVADGAVAAYMVQAYLSNAGTLEAP